MAIFRMILVLLLFGFQLEARAKGDNEIGFNFGYLDDQAATDEGTVHSTHFSLGGMYLRNLKTYWTGGELTYDTYTSETLSTSTILLGVPLKYWFKGPDSKGVGVYVFVTPYLGKVDTGSEAGTVIGLKMGPALVVFLSDMVGVDIKILYDYRKTGGLTSTTTGLTAGFSVYF